MPGSKAATGGARAEQPGADAHTRRQRRLGLLTLALVGLAWAGLIQAPGANQNAHLALMTALEQHHSPRVDAYRNWTGDLSYIRGHYYIAKAPGLALLTFPWFLVLHDAGLTVKGPPASIPWPASQAQMSPTALWEVGLIGATLPAFVLLVLVRSAAERLVPGYGTAAALTVGTASLLAVLATMFFAHSLATCLGFAAFGVVLQERRGRPRTRLLAAAGFLAGLAVAVDFPLGIVAVAVGAYGVLRSGRVRRAAAYTGGFVVGIVPLLAFNTWAFGSPTTLAYTNAIIQPGASGHAVIGANSSGFFGIGRPSLRAGAELLFAGHGLLVLSPVLALAVYGFISLWRAGSRAEASTAAGIGAAFLLYDASYYQPFGGFPAGARFLVPSLPFLALGVAAAWRARPRMTSTLFLASVAVTTAALVGQPLGSSQSAGAWFHRLEHGDATETVFHWITMQHAAGEVIPIVALLAAAIAIGLVVTPGFRLDLHAAGLAVAVLVAWRIVYTGAPIMLTVDSQTGGWAGLAGVIALALALLLVFAGTTQHRPAAVLPALLLVPVAWPRFAAHTGIAFSTIAVATAALAATVSLPRLRKTTA